MQKIIKWIFVLLFLGVTLFIIFFLISINSSEKLIEKEPLTLKNEVVEKKSDDIWLNHFSKIEKSGYSYPVNEVYVKVDLDDITLKSATITKPKTTTYKLSASLLDPYQTFCLKEELKHHDLKYYLEKDKTNTELLIFSDSIKKLNSLVEVLKNYQISANIMPHTKEIIK